MDGSFMVGSRIRFFSNISMEMGIHIMNGILEKYQRENKKNGQFQILMLSTRSLNDVSYSLSCLIITSQA